MNLLFIADTTSIHEYKKISYFSKQQGNNCYVIPYDEHDELYQKSAYWQALYADAGITILNPIPYFSLTNFKQTLKVRSYIKQIILENKIDAFIIIYVEPSALLALFRNYFEVPVLLYTFGTDVLKTIPSFFGKSHPFKKIIAYLYKKAFNMADAIAGTSSLQLKMVTKLSGREKDLYLIRTGVNMEQIDADTKKYLPEELKDKKIVFFPRNMLPIYDHDLALDAVALLPIDLKEEYTFVFVNSDSANASYVEEITKKMQTIKNVSFCFLPTISQVSIFEINKQASLVVMTPVSDGSPVSAMEAMACNVPLILPPLGYDNDIFSEGVYHLKTREAKELAFAMEQVLTKKIPLDINKANNNIREKVDYHKEMVRLENIIKSIV